MDREVKTPSRLIYMGAVLDALRASGGAAPSKEIYRILIQRGVARASDLARIQRSRESRFVKEVRFARKELVDAGLLFNGPGGVWSLSLSGWGTCLTPEDARKLVHIRRRGGTVPRPPEDPSTGIDPMDPTTGPAPTDWTRIVSRSSDGRAWTYVMRYGSTDIWKIGFASDVDARLVEINTHIPFEITSCQWAHYARHPWPDSHLAYGMEQRLLRALEAVRTARERVRCPEATLLGAWREAVGYTAVDVVT